MASADSSPLSEPMDLDDDFLVGNTHFLRSSVKRSSSDLDNSVSDEHTIASSVTDSQVESAIVDVPLIEQRNVIIEKIEDILTSLAESLETETPITIPIRRRPRSDSRPGASSRTSEVVMFPGSSDQENRRFGMLLSCF